MKRFLTFVFLIALIGLVALNWKTLLNFGRAREVEQSAQKAIEAGNWELAIASYESAYKQFPENDQLASRLAWLYKKNGQLPKAETVYRQVLKQNPAQLEALSGLTNILAQDSRRVNEAVIMLRKALKATPEDPRLLGLTGDLYKTAAENPEETRPETQKWLYEQAGYYYKQALRLNPNAFDVAFSQGVVLHNLNQNEAAAKAYCTAILKQPNSYEARYNLGLALSELRYQGEAYRQMERAIEILSDRNEMNQAQALALQVQQVKNRVFHSTQGTLSEAEAPAFLPKGCLLQPSAEKETSHN